MKLLFLSILTTSLLTLNSCDSCSTSGSQSNSNGDHRTSELSDFSNRNEELSNNSSSSESDTEEDDIYHDNSLSTGTVPYSCSGLYGDESVITVRTSSLSDQDVVVLVKNAGILVRNAYITAGDSYSFRLPDGRYQVFFYSGRGWNPDKSMPDGSFGGFVADESFSKDMPTDLDSQELTYELIPQPNGNFNTIPSSPDEIF